MSKNIEEAIHSLRYKPVNSTTLERLRLCVEANKHVSGLPQAQEIGHGLGYILDNISIPVEPHDILIGRISEEIPDEEGERFFAETISTMGTRPLWMNDGGHESFRWDILLQQGFVGLETAAKEELCRLKNRRSAISEVDGLATVEDTIIFVEGTVLIYQAFRNYTRRCAQSAKEAGLLDAAECLTAIADNPPANFREALQLIWTLELVYCTICAINPTLTLGRLDKLLIDFYRNDIKNGILDEESASDMIIDFYCKNNIILGRGEHQLSYGDAKDTGWDRNLCYDAPQYLTLGGFDSSGFDISDFNSTDFDSSEINSSEINSSNFDSKLKCVDNELTMLFIKNIVPRFKNPLIVYRYCSQSDPDIWRALCDKMAEGSSVMIYNDHIIIDSMIKSGVNPNDAVEYEMFGCNWPSVSGNSVTPLVLHCSYTHYMLDLLDEICTKEAGNQSNANQIDINQSNADQIDVEQININIFYQRLEAHAKSIITDAFLKCKNRALDWPKHRPGTLRVDDCFMQGKEKKPYAKDAGALDYTIFLFVASHIGSAVDCITALDKLVFIDKKVTLNEINSALRDDFRGHEYLRQLCKNAPKYGQDNDLSNKHAKLLIDLHHRIINDLDPNIERTNTVINDLSPIIEGSNLCESNSQGVILSSFETDNFHVITGEQTGATPDGRLYGTHLSQNASPTWGSCINGLTALLMSAAKTPKDLIASGALNVQINKSFLADPVGRKLFPDVVKTYFDSGGLQIQCTITSLEELRAAQENPDRYRDLMVRITGYSVSFVDMSTKSQDAFIAREEMMV